MSLTFRHQYAFQDDARQYVSWMQRCEDPTLFPNDLIADCFQSGSPPGFATLYRFGARIGVGPVLLSKFLPLALGLMATGFAYAIFLRFLPSSPGAFLAAVLLNQNMWANDDLVSATPRAFACPLFLAFLFFLLKRSRIWIGITVAMLGLFFPPLALLAVAVLTVRLLSWPGFRFRFSFSRNKTDWVLWLVGMVAALLSLLHYKISPSSHGPLITLEQARQEPACNLVGNGQGRTLFCDPNPVRFWLFNQDSGCLALRVVPLTIFPALLLPWCLRRPDRFPLAARVTEETRCLNQMLLASLGMFLLAHACLFELYFPSRYTVHSLRLVLALAGGLVLALVFDRAGRLDARSERGPRWRIGTMVLALVTVSILQRPTISDQGFIIGQTPEIYEHLARQPKDALTASLSLEADNIPIFARRSVLVAREYAYPYQTGYYAEIRQRCRDLIEAQYSPDLEVVQRFIQKYRVNFILVDENAFTTDYLKNYTWLWQFQPGTTNALGNLQRGLTPALAKIASHATVVESHGRRLLDAKVILQVEK